jgi:hypothetical protein
MSTAARYRAALAATMLVPLAAPSAGAQWAVDTRPVLDIAGLSPGGEVLLENVAAATRLADGTIVVADQSASHVRFFDAGGRLLRTVGRRGAGPGEFDLLLWLGRCAGDTLFAWDYGLRRMTVISPSGAIVRQTSFPAGDELARAPTTLTCSPGGRFAIQPPAIPGRDPMEVLTTDTSIIRGRAPVTVVDREGRRVADLGDIWAGEMFFTGRSGGPRGGGFRPLGRATSLAMLDDRVFIGTADSAAVEVFGLDGRRLTTVSLAIPPRRATRGHLERAIDEMLPLFPGPIRAGIRQRMLALPLPERLPAYSAVLVDPHATLWVVASVPGDPDTRLLAVNPAGRQAADLRLPVRIRVFEVGPDYILAGYEDSNDEPHVAVFRLRR